VPPAPDAFFAQGDIQGNPVLDQVQDQFNANAGNLVLNTSSWGGCMIDSMKNSLSPGSEIAWGLGWLSAVATGPLPTYLGPPLVLTQAEGKAVGDCAGKK
jgi:hypothetical protein